MPIVLQQISLAPGEPESELRAAAAKRLRVSPDAIQAFSVLRRAIDARRRGTVQFVYHLEVALAGGPRQEQQRVQKLGRSDIRLWIQPPREVPEPGPEAMRHRPVVVGLGPAGMFAGLMLARAGYRPIVLERGQAVQQRHADIMQRFYRQRDFDPESNLLFGEGGAGTYSDGKLYTRVRHPYVADVIATFFEHGADAEILVSSRPHIGSDRLPNICMRIREEILARGGEVRFGQRLEDLQLSDDGSVTGAVTADGVMTTNVVILGIGHSAQDTFIRLAQLGVHLVARPFQMGVRIEHPQAIVDGWQYRELAGHADLPPADYHLVARRAAVDGGDVYSFCMCPGGSILPTHEAPGLVATNGASRAARGGQFANSGLVVTVAPAMFDDDPLKGLALQRHYEAAAFHQGGGTYAVPAQRACDFLAAKASDGAIHTSYPLGGCWADLRTVLPKDVVTSVAQAISQLDGPLPGFGGGDGLVTGPETRASSPVRIERDQTTRMAVRNPGLYPVGEGAGYAGGIISAAIDGMKTADQIIRCFACPK
jgi:hypothetical protein